MTWLIDTLRRLASWLESRRKPQVYATEDVVGLLATKVTLVEEQVTRVMVRQEEEIQKLKGEVQKLSLHAGFTRPMQTGARRP